MSYISKFGNITDYNKKATDAKKEAVNAVVEVVAAKEVVKVVAAKAVEANKEKFKKIVKKIEEFEEKAKTSATKTEEEADKAITLVTEIRAILKMLYPLSNEVSEESVPVAVAPVLVAPATAATAEKEKAPVKEIDIVIVEIKSLYEAILTKYQKDEIVKDEFSGELIDKIRILEDIRISLFLHNEEFTQKQFEKIYFEVFFSVERQTFS